MSAREKFGVCPLCGRTCALTYHHLIPRKMHRRPYFKKHFTVEERNAGVNICRLCHNGIHDLYDEMTLAKQFASLEKLQQDGQLKLHYNWVAKQKVRT